MNPRGFGPDRRNCRLRGGIRVSSEGCWCAQEQKASGSRNGFRGKGHPYGQHGGRSAICRQFRCAQAIPRPVGACASITCGRDQGWRPDGAHGRCAGTGPAERVEFANRSLMQQRMRRSGQCWGGKVVRPSSRSVRCRNRDVSTMRAAAWCAAEGESARQATGLGSETGPRRLTCNGQPPPRDSGCHP